MKQPIIKLSSFLFFLLAMTVILIPVVVFGDQGAGNTPLTGYNLPKASVATPTQLVYPIDVLLVDGSQQCRVISSSTSASYFVPTKYADLEWTAFAAHYPLQTLPACCGNGLCETAGLGAYKETVNNCLNDCQVGYCGNSVCDTGETTVSCSFDCTYGACLKDSNEIGWITICPGFIDQFNCDATHCIWSGNTCTAKVAPAVETCNQTQTLSVCNAIWGCIWCAGCHRNYWWCGDDICSSTISENSTSCPQDCGGVYCGDGICNNGENCVSCVDDCANCPSVCGNGACDWDETCACCSSDCGVCDYSCLGPSGCEVYNRSVDCNTAGGGCSWGRPLCN